MAETHSVKARAYTAAGTPRDAVALPETLFDGTYVTGGNQKPWRQKGTGRARQGSTRAPQWVGGGTVFGPTPRSYRQELPKQVKALGRKSALNARARENAVIVIDQFNYEAPKTSVLAGLVERLGVAEQKILILTNGVKENVFLSGRNLPNVHVMPYSDVSTYHVLWSDVVLIESEALGEKLDTIAEDEHATRAAEKHATKAAAKKSAPASKKPKPEAKAKPVKAEAKANVKKSKAASPKASKKSASSAKPKKRGK